VLDEIKLDFKDSTRVRDRARWSTHRIHVERHFHQCRRTECKPASPLSATTGAACGKYPPRRGRKFGPEVSITPVSVVHVPSAGARRKAVGSKSPAARQLQVPLTTVRRVRSAPTGGTSVAPIHAALHERHSFQPLLNVPASCHSEERSDEEPAVQGHRQSDSRSARNDKQKQKRPELARPFAANFSCRLQNLRHDPIDSIFSQMIHNAGRRQNSFLTLCSTNTLALA